MKKLTLLLLFALTSCSSKHFPPGSSHFVPQRAANIFMTWTASTGSVTGYKVEVSKDNGATFIFVTNTTDLSANVPNLLSGASYIVRVSAFNPGGSSVAASAHVDISL